MKIRTFLKTALFAAATFILITMTSLSVTADSQSEQVQEIIDRGTLRVGVKQDVPNFGYLNSETNEYEGMEIEIARKIADDLGVKVELTPVTTQTREPLMDNGQVDIIIATYTITEERQNSYAISEPYYYDQIGFLVNKGSDITSIEDLDGLNIGVPQGATTKANLKAYAEEHGLNFDFTELGSYPELAISLYANRIDAFSVDKSLLSGYISKHSVMLDEGFNTQEYGIASKKTNTELIDYINNLLNDWKEDGSLEAIYDEFGLESADSNEE